MADITSSAAVLLFLFVSLSTGLLVRWIGRHWARIGELLPYTVLLIVLGVLYGLIQLLSDRDDFAFAEHIISSLDPDLILLIFLPALLFDSCYNIHFHVIWKSFVSAVLLAGPGVIVCMVMVAVVAHYGFTDYQWDWYTCFMYGSILAATDPVAVVALLREVGAPVKISTLIEGEALFNDGSAFVCYIIFERLQTGTLHGVGDSIGLFLQTSLGGIGFGLGFGIALVWWLGIVFNDTEVEVGSTIVGAFFCFFIAQIYINVSSVLAVVTLGLYVGKYRNNISPAVQPQMQAIWSMIAYLLNTTLFVLAGVIICEQLISLRITGADVWYMFLTYAVLLVARGVSVLLLQPLMAYSGTYLSWKECIMLTWSGLRGAIALVLALLTVFSVDPAISDKVVFLTGGIVILTTVINGVTTRKLIQLLGLNDPSPGSHLVLRQAMSAMQHRSGNKVAALRRLPQFRGVNWKWVSKYLPEQLIDLRVAGREPTSEMMSRRYTMELDDTSDRETLRNELRRRYITALLAEWYAQFSCGMVTRNTLRILLEAGESASESDYPLKYTWEHISANFAVPWWLRTLYQASKVRQRSHYANKWISNAMFQHLCQSIELATAYLTAHSKVAQLLTSYPELNAVDSSVVSIVQQEAQQYHQQAHRAYLDVQQSYREAYHSVQTRHAAQSILYSELKEVQSLNDTGTLDEQEYGHLKDKFESNIYWLEREPFAGTLPDATTMLREMPLIASLPSHLRPIILKSATKRFYQHGELLAKFGQRLPGFIVLVRGTVTVKYSDNDSDFVNLPIDVAGSNDDVNYDEEKDHQERDEVEEALLTMTTDGLEVGDVYATLNETWPQLLQNDHYIAPDTANETLLQRLNHKTPAAMVRKEKVTSPAIIGAHNSMSLGASFTAAARTLVEAFWIPRSAVDALNEDSTVPPDIFLVMAQQLLKSRFFTYLQVNNIPFQSAERLVGESTYEQCVTPTSTRTAEDSDSRYRHASAKRKLVQLEPGQRLLLITGACQRVFAPSSPVRHSGFEFATPSKVQDTETKEQQVSHAEVAPSVVVQIDTSDAAASQNPTPRDSFADRPFSHEPSAVGSQLQQSTLGDEDTPIPSSTPSPRHDVLTTAPCLLSADADTVTYTMLGICRYIRWNAEVEAQISQAELQKQQAAASERPSSNDQQRLAISVLPPTRASSDLRLRPNTVPARSEDAESDAQQAYNLQTLPPTFRGALDDLFSPRTTRGNVRDWNEHTSNSNGTYRRRNGDAEQSGHTSASTRNFVDAVGSALLPESLTSTPHQQKRSTRRASILSNLFNPLTKLELQQIEEDERKDGSQ